MLFKKKRIDIKTNTSNVGENLNFATREAYNLLRTNINFALAAKDAGKIVGITSSCPQEGKSYTSINLAYSFAKDNKRVLLIEADMRRGSIASDLAIKNEKGLSDLLVDKNADAIIKEVLHPNLSAIFSGKNPPNPSELLGSDNMAELLEEFSKQYDVILLDLPPVLAVADALAVSKFLSGVVVVVRHGLTRRKDVIETVRELQFSKVHILGFVYNDFSEGHHSYSKKKYYKKYYEKKHYYEPENNKENITTTESKE